MNSNINLENWNYCYFENKDLKAMVSLAMDPDSDQNEYYLVSVIDNEHNELFQRKFPQLGDACRYINSKYLNIWELISLQNDSSTSGCSGCVAH